ncbi:putative phosphatase [Cladorrhinum samala]|uniref:Phosphatase n=1 Tax=Cladorrhinum samala TaxID=585594 RepID=A0AAV9HLP4_9PEZI|nr:putative phosphatase [Cladorrhinum samala]
MMGTVTWHNLERNKMQADEAFRQLSVEFNVDQTLIQKALDQAQSTLRINKEIEALINELVAAKARNSRIKVYAMSNIAEDHFLCLQKVPFLWSVFDKVFTSFNAGMRKPDLSFFRYVIEQTGCNPRNTLYLDDKPENICAGRALGLRGEIVSRDGRTRVCNLVRNLLFNDAFSRAEHFLRSNARHLHSVMETGAEDVVFKDNYAQLLIWGLTGMEDIIYLTWPDGVTQGLDEEKDSPDKMLVGENQSISLSTASASVDTGRHSTTDHPIPSGLEVNLWAYFGQGTVGTTGTFPRDFDTTSIAYVTVPQAYLQRLAAPSVIAEIMFAHRDSDGLMETYFGTHRPRVSPEVCVNIFRFLNKFGDAVGLPSLDVSDARIAPSKELIINTLAYRAVLYGSRFYTEPEAFLYFVSMLYCECKENSPQFAAELKMHLEPALMERLHVQTNPLALAMRIRSCQLMNVKEQFVQSDLESLLEMQQADGGWPAGHFCRTGRSGLNIGSRGLTTALMWRILKDYKL